MKARHGYQNLAAFKSIAARFLVASLALAMVSGCISTRPIPGYARSGDLVSVNLGGIKRNTDDGTGMPVDILKPGQLTVTITDSASTVHQALVRYTYRAYPDFTSNYAVDALDRDNGWISGAGAPLPYDGAWWTTIQLVDFATNDPLPLATGPATIAVASSSLVDTGWDTGSGGEGSLASLSIEILPGTATPNDVDAYQFFAFAPAPALSIRPDDLAGITDIGGVQVQVTYNTSALTTSTSTVKPQIVPLSHDPNVNIIQRTVDNGDGTESVMALVTNPNGFVPAASWSVGKSTFADLQFAVIVQESGPILKQATWASNFWIDTANSFYIDSNGDEIPTVEPVLSLAR